jgi:hypothetical protein
MSIRHYRLDRVRAATSRSGAIKRDDPATTEICVKTRSIDGGTHNAYGMMSALRA